MKSLKSAIACPQRAIDLSGGAPLLFHNLGTALAADGRHGEAVAAFSHALAIRPDHDIAAWDRARSYLYLGNCRQGWIGLALAGRRPVLLPPIPRRRWRSSTS